MELEWNSGYVTEFPKESGTGPSIELVATADRVAGLLSAEASSVIGIAVASPLHNGRLVSRIAVMEHRITDPVEDS